MVLRTREPTEWQNSKEVAEEVGAHWVLGGTANIQVLPLKAATNGV